MSTNHFHERVVGPRVGPRPRASDAVACPEAVLQEQGRPATLQDAIRHDRNPVAENVCLVHEVGRQHNDAILADALDHVPRRAPAEGVHARGRLVEEADAGPTDEREAQGQLPLLPARQRACPGLCLLRKAHMEHHVASPHLHLLWHHATEASIDLEVLGHGQLGPEHVVLRADADDLPDLAQVGAQCVPGDEGVAARRLGHADEHVDRRGLPRAVMPEQCQDLPLVHCEVQARHGHPVAARRGEDLPKARRAHHRARSAGAREHRRGHLLHDVASGATRGRQPLPVVQLVGHGGLRPIPPIGARAQEEHRQPSAELLRDHPIAVPPEERPEEDVEDHHAEHTPERVVIHCPKEVRPRHTDLRRLELGQSVQTGAERSVWHHHQQHQHARRGRVALVLRHVQDPLDKHDHHADNATGPGVVEEAVDKQREGQKRHAPQPKEKKQQDAARAREDVVAGHVRKDRTQDSEDYAIGDVPRAEYRKAAHAQHPQTLANLGLLLCDQLVEHLLLSVEEGCDEHQRENDSDQLEETVQDPACDGHGDGLYSLG
mmetsp:Transcript_15944/g.46132  ORF Transcript_15944/g.46132 Transcript_15944/m.46132 type:complete len:547 (+) Transcript_15944:46-1686(+)